MEWRGKVITLDSDDVDCYFGQVLMDNHEYVTHNGALIARFSREAARAIVADVNRVHDEYPDASARLEWRGGAVVETSPEGDVITYAPDADGMFHIGERAWRWVLPS